MNWLLLVASLFALASSASAAAPTLKGSPDELMRAELDRGERAFRRRAFGEAIAAATRIIQTDRMNTNAYLLRGKAYEESYQHEKAVADFDMVLRLEPRPRWFINIAATNGSSWG
jgi:Tfp pilus assembly protein PilF